MNKRYTYDEIRDYIDSVEGYKLISKKYTSSSTKLLIKHLSCGNSYKASWSVFKRGHRCPYCAHRSFKYSYEEVKSYIESFNDYRLISKEYNTSHTKLLVKHLICGNEYNVSFDKFKNSYKRCPFCNKGVKLLYNDVKSYIESFEGYKLISKEYVNNQTKLIIRHLECGTKYEVVFSSFKKGHRCPFCSTTMKAKYLGVTGKPLYDFYAPQIEFCEEVKRDHENYHVLQVRCKNSNCRQWFIPTLKQVYNKLYSLQGKQEGENNFYCSEECKNTCSIFRQQTYPKGHKPYRDNLERDPYWRQLVLERDNFECQICGSTEKLEAHHIDSINTNPIMSADLENGITLCKKCHKKIHEDVGCRYIDLRKDKICKEVR